MPDQQRGTDRAGRRAKRFLSPSQKYEVFLQLVRQELTMAEAAEAWQVDRGTIMRIRTVAKEGEAHEAVARVRGRAFLRSAPDRIRTCDLPLRRRSLYPPELPGQPDSTLRGGELESRHTSGKFSSSHKGEYGLSAHAGARVLKIVPSSAVR